MQKSNTISKLNDHKLILSLTLAKNESLRFIECISAEEHNCIDVNPTDFKRFDIESPDNISNSYSRLVQIIVGKAQDWLLEHKNESYLKISANVRYIEENKDHEKIYSSRWKILFVRDE